ncbi:hypothetical protein PHLGIDRAFT_327497 [Phlebiopsis gigantea 11061_1 CR5-6]|uniref:Uncharacterized protein n=1 Tax=Phlebiopsis gigantea (strain 11061_1 CR5-6) TaxID=745531 RepID=A0A0C3SFK3_PHLG1|nr:hypothetical protein PHLGIDRAFT_327497 [Phlebiopsis gigantea 11061_1 CR5-6]
MPHTPHAASCKLGQESTHDRETYNERKRGDGLSAAAAHVIDLRDSTKMVRPTRAHMREDLCPGVRTAYEQERRPGSWESAQDKRLYYAGLWIALRHDGGTRPLADLRNENILKNKSIKCGRNAYCLNEKVFAEGGGRGRLGVVVNGDIGPADEIYVQFKPEIDLNPWATRR